MVKDGLQLVEEKLTNYDRVNEISLVRCDLV